jgi:outer membrane protein assembly factor BamD (BamD/ComL family)
MKICLLILLVLHLSLSSCAYMEQAIERMHEKFTSFENSDNDVIRKKLANLVQSGDYTTAVDLIMAEVENGKYETTYDGLYVASINGLIKSGMEYYAEGDYGRAGIAFTKTIDNFPSSRSIAYRIKSSPKEIKPYIETITNKLMEEGLKEYRGGNLGNAISTWRKIVEYHPDNSEANKMIDITTIQMKNLRVIE